MMNNKTYIKELPESFYQEEKILISNEINSWESLLSIICTLNIDIREASLLMHSGLISNEAIARLSPQELVQKTGRFERILQTGRIPIIDLKKAHLLIKKAKEKIHKFP